MYLKVSQLLNQLDFVKKIRFTSLASRTLFYCIDMKCNYNLCALVFGN